MPRSDGLGFVIWPNDHDPAQVHCLSANAEATIEFGNPGDEPRLVENRCMKRSEVAKALKAVFDNQSILRHRWTEFHG